MATANSFDFRVCDLEAGTDEDRTVAERCHDVVATIQVGLKPIMRYIARPRAAIDKMDLKCVYIMNIRATDYPFERTGEAVSMDLMMDEGAQFFTAEANADGLFFRISRDTFWVWKCVPFSEFLEKLQQMLAEARAGRELHLQAIAERSAKLDEIIAILKK